ncbi:hypothetical protein CPB83DRAFT_855969 [Crepidotus variabilis]|uniref:Borealin N-terminal domain-containing protein n=1 Tax=Crepidotus variabilis TaxID=179855 RepID=A0A9P6JPG0_9AGAR|nr:hypothetical protein CPB83DRAFT_855969 [Crepidotus variabilis]
MELPTTKRRYTDEEKKQLIANLDIEVAHRTRQLKADLDVKLETFILYQQAQISRIPKQVRNMTIREFGEKYEGDLQSALRGYQKERLAAAGIDASAGEIDKNERKRKWVASQEVETEASGSLSQSKEAEPPRAAKTARTQLHSPKKAGSSTGPGTAQGSRLTALNRTPGASRTMSRIPQSPSPQKQRPPFNNTTSTFNPHATARPTSPLKSQLSKQSVAPSNPQSRVPSSSKFNPSLPSKTPAFPPRTNTNAGTQMRLPRKDENLLSVNGSPLANPYEFGLGWFKGVQAQAQADDMDESQDLSDLSEDQNTRTLKRTKSSIVIRRDPSVAFPSALNGVHSRTDSQLSFYTASDQTTSSSHSRDDSHPALGQPPPSTLAQPNNPLTTFRFPSSRPVNSGFGNTDMTPKPKTHVRTFSAMVAIPTKDGHVLEFDPLQTSPGALDALEGITDSTKKQAKAEMGRLIQATVDKWRIR